MSKEIKKRVKDSEIEVAKSSNKKLFIITIIILLLIIVGLVLFLLYDYKIIFPPKDTTPVVDNNKKKITTTRHEDKYVDVDVDSPRIINLYNSVYSGNIDSYLFDSKKVDVSDMSEDYKFQVAFNTYVKDITYLPTAYVSEKKKKNAYENVFGKDTYKRPEKLSDGCNDMVFDNLSKAFISEQTGCGTTTSFGSNSKIISVKKNSSELLITAAYVFNYMDKLYKDPNGNEELTENDGEYTTVRHYNSYIEENKDKLMQYTFKFNLADDGFYYYSGFERTNG